jgi:SNF family Na+-dependent transporter
MYFLELAIGQYSGMGCSRVFSGMAPVFQGLGWAMVVISALSGLYYNMIIGWALLYLVYSCFPTLPWGNCGNWWNTAGTVEKSEDRSPQCRAPVASS